MSTEARNEAREALIQRLMRIQKLARAAVVWQMAGCPIEDPHDTYPNELYDASVMATSMVRLLDEVFAALASPLEGAGDGSESVSVPPGSGVSGEACGSTEPGQDAQDGQGVQEQSTDINFRLRMARMMAELHGEEVLSEQQCARYMGIDLVSWRKLERCFSAGTSFVEGDGEEFPAEDSETILRSAIDTAMAAGKGGAA